MTAATAQVLYPVGFSPLASKLLMKSQVWTCSVPLEL